MQRNLNSSQGKFKSPESDGYNSYLSQLMTNMTSPSPALPPEILRIVASYLDRDVLLTLGMTSRFFAEIFAGIYYNSWEVCCCAEVQRATVTISGHMGKYNLTNMDRFFRALNSGLAPVYAKRVQFNFCMHPRSENHPESWPKKSLQKSWPLEQTGELLKLLNASEIVVKIWNPRNLSYICHEPFLRRLLRESTCALRNAVVKLRMENRVIYGGSYYFTIRDSSTSLTTVADNLQRALRLIRYPISDYDLWDAHELYRILYAQEIIDTYPNVRDLSFSHIDASKTHTAWSATYVAQPEEYLTAYPQCQRLTCRWRTLGHYECLETKYCFDNVSAQERKCTKILVHNELFNWVFELLELKVDLKHVRVLEFHHARYEAFVRKWGSPYTPATLNILLACLLQPFPNLERMILKFGTDMELITNHPGILSKDFCEHCELDVNFLEFDIRTMLREGRLSAVEPRSAVDLLLKMGNNTLIDGA